jgi:hypothetical protein
MSQSTEISVREADGIFDISDEARIAEAYSRLYAQALPLAREGDQSTLDRFFGAIEKTLNEREKVYNYAVDRNEPDAEKKGKDF